MCPCRICLGEDMREAQNPLITPCKCAGSVRYVHLQCLKRWIQQRVRVEQHSNSVTVFWKSLSCELCKTPYPFAVYFDGKIHELIEVPIPPTPFVIFEGLSREGHESTGMYIATFAYKSSLTIVS